MEKKAYITTQNNTVYQGISFGAQNAAQGEIVFCTAMTGVTESLTDPNNAGLIVVQTFPSAGNYGVIKEDFESPKPHIRGFAVKEKCNFPSNFRSNLSLEDFFIEHNIPAVYGIDTRALVKEIQTHGGRLYANITFEKPDYTFHTEEKIKDGLSDLVTAASRENSVTYGDSDIKIALIDMGANKSLINSLLKRNLSVTVIPAAKVKEYDLTNYSAVVFSDGPGDPKKNTLLIQTAKKLFGKKALLGIGLGHQIMALAVGADTKRLKNSHRGANIAVKNTQTGKINMTVQNHAYTVVSIPDNIIITHINVTDGSCEGLKYADNTFSVQFQPEQTGGDSLPYIYDDFVAALAKTDKGVM